MFINTKFKDITNLFSMISIRCGWCAIDFDYNFYTLKNYSLYNYFLVQFSLCMISNSLFLHHLGMYMKIYGHLRLTGLCIVFQYLKYSGVRCAMHSRLQTVPASLRCRYVKQLVRTDQLNKEFGLFFC